MHDDARNPLMPRQPVTATLTVTAQEKAISDKLIGIFFEDISYAADGGLYAELVQNRDFEYTARDRLYHWHHTVGPLQDRKPDFNIWHYHQTRGLG